MSANYYVLPTEYGLALMAKAHQGQSIELKNLVLGDANGQPYTPEHRRTATALVNQRASVAIQSIQPVDARTIRITATLPSRVGGFFIHEIGLTDINNKLIYVGNYHGGYKPSFTEGASSDMEFNIDVKVENTSQINILANDSIIANQDWVNEQIRLIREHFEAQLKIERERVIEDVSVGELFFTTIDFKTSEEVTKHKGYGKWARFGNGEAIISLRHKDTVLGQEWLNKIGGFGGAYTHQLSKDELPAHNHASQEFDQLMTASYGTGTIRGRATDSSWGEPSVGTSRLITTVGKNHAHNNIQPSIVVGVWQRLPDTAVKYDGTIKLDGSHRYE